MGHRVLIEPLEHHAITIPMDASCPKLVSIASQQHFCPCVANYFKAKLIANR